MFNIQQRLLQSAVNLSYFRPIYEAAFSSHYRTVNFVHAHLRVHNINAKKIWDTFLLQCKCRHYSIVTVGYPLFAMFTSKFVDKVVGMSSLLSIFTVCASRIFLWCHQDRHIPSGAKLYLQKPKRTHTVNIPHTHSVPYLPRTIQLPTHRPIYYPDSNVDWPNLGPTSVLSSRRWVNVSPTCIAVWVGGIMGV